MGRGRKKDRFDYTPFKQEVRRIRQGIGWTQAQVASGVGFERDGDKGAICALEKGRVALTPVRRRRLIELLAKEAAACGMDDVTRVNLYRLANLSCPDEETDEDNGTASSWQEMRQAGRQKADQFHFVEARKELRKAEALAETNSQKALVVAEQVFCHRMLNDVGAALKTAQRFLQILDLSDLPFTGVVPLQRVDISLWRRFPDDIVVAYLTVTCQVAQLYFDMEEYPKEEQACQRWEQVGWLLHDATIRADVAKFRARLRMRQATDPTKPELSPEAVAVPSFLALAGQDLQSARLFRTTADELGRAGDARQNAMLQCLLNQPQVACAEEDVVEYHLTGRTKLINLRLQQGKREAAARHGRLAEALLRHVSAEACAIQSPILLSGTLATLAQIYSTVPEVLDKRLALDCCLASLLLWPYAYLQRDALRMTTLLEAFLRSWDDERGHIDVTDRLATARDFPFELLPDMPNLTQRHQATAIAYLREVQERVYRGRRQIII